MPELVAYDEGLFAKEGLLVEWADRDQGVAKKIESDVTSPKGVDSFASHGRLFEQGKADMYNAREGGNYRRVQDPASAAGRSVAAPSSRRKKILLERLALIRLAEATTAL